MFWTRPLTHKLSAADPALLVIKVSLSWRTEMIHSAVRTFKQTQPLKWMRLAFYKEHNWSTDEDWFLVDPNGPVIATVIL